MTITETQTPPTTPTNLRPVAPTERVETLDILRGFALFGVLAVNIGSFSGLPVDPFSFYIPPPGTLDWAAAWLVDFFLTAKSYSMFALLFGLGLAIQMERAAAKEQSFGPFFLRRMLVLFLIGLAHGCLLWQGDILMVYALLGCLLFMLRKIQLSTMLIWAGMLLAILFLAYLASGIAAATAGLWAGGQEFMREMETQRSQPLTVEAIAAITESFRNGGFREVLDARLTQLAAVFPIQLIDGFPNIFSMILLGFYAGQRRLLTRPGEHVTLLRRLLLWGLLIGIPANLVYAAVYTTINPTSLTASIFFATALHSVGAPALMLGYLAAITLLVARQGFWGRALHVLAPMGRMALSNYVGQSVLMNLIFYSYGLAFLPALYAQTNAAINLGITIAIFVIQIIVSSVWLRFFRFGPLEWLWRSLTYGKLQPMRRTTVS